MKKITALLLSILILLPALTACGSAQMQSEIDALKTEMIILKEEIAVLRNNETGYKYAIDALKSEFSELNGTATNLRQEVGLLKTHEDENLDKINALQSKIAALNKEIEKLQAELDTLTRRLDHSDVYIDLFMDWASEYKEEIRTLQNEIAALKGETPDKGDSSDEVMNDSVLFANYASVLDMYSELVDCFWDNWHEESAEFDAISAQAKNETEKEWCEETYNAIKSFWSDREDEAAFKKTYGYAFYDINKDGTDELLLLKDDYHLLAVYTKNEKGPVLLMRFIPRGYGWIDEDGYLQVHGSGGAGYDTYYKYELRGSELVLTVKTLMKDYEGIYTVTYEDGEEQKITEEDFERIVRAEHSFFPFRSESDYMEFVLESGFMPIYRAEDSE